MSANRFGEDENRFSFCRRTSERKGNSPNKEKWDHYKKLPLTDLVALCDGTKDEKINSILGAFDAHGKLTDPQRNCLIYYCIENLEWED